MPFINEDEVQGLEPIAIVGMACRLPGSIDSPSKLWQTLRDTRSVRNDRVPSNRFNIDAHYHPDLSRPGSYSTLGGYFLDGNPVDFDPSFFNMTPVEAQWLDPQQRKMLEVCYEVFENAGVRLDELAGSNTGVYAASFTSDYQQMSVFERDFRHNYAATGVDPGLISTRINHAFDLNGPSSVVNTACSSALYAIHNACHALRARDCDGAVASGSNLVMMVDQQMNTAKLGVLSPTSECHTFDESADGYGRAEGVGALYLKRLSDALRDGNLIRGVIRTSAVNTNGKVPGMGITFPNKYGQERVLRQAYTRANLDPSHTAYLECHGTGTPTGDPIEVEAVSRGMNDSRSLESPLILGAVKANIGHSEAASGIFATMKAALMTEKAEIPAVHGFTNLNPAIKDKDWNVKIASSLMKWPEEFDVRRASVSSFGYGGTNAHLVVEAVDDLCPWYAHGRPKTEAKYTYDPASIDRPFLITMSAHDQTTLVRNIKAHCEVVGDYYIPDLAYTLNEKRTCFAGARGYTIGWPNLEADAFSPDEFVYGSKLSQPKDAQQQGIGFVFTGQGSQWARMGHEALQKIPLFGETIDALDRVLKRAVPPKYRPSWSLRRILAEPPDSSCVGQPDISQPACTAIQIAIVDVFASWGITPAVCVGHSSGEIAAAYAAGRVSAPEAILAAYFRGLAVSKVAPEGSMLAVGLGAQEIEQYINLLPPDAADRVSIACENSPGSTTLSSTKEDITALKKTFDDFGIFARELKTGKAYHSWHMDAVAPLYKQLYTEAHKALAETDISWRQAEVGMVSSVTASVVEDSDLSISYWCENLRNRVRFDSAVQEMGKNPEFCNVRVLVEIGPHPALRGAVNQICAEHNLDLQQIGSLVRGQNDAVALLKTAGELFLLGAGVRFDMVNKFRNATPVDVKSGVQSQPRCLVDLPAYQWNYERQYWHQPRDIADLRSSKHPRHDVLGRRVFGLSSNAPTWKNILRQRDVKWFSHHVLGTDVVFPAAGYISLAIEGLLQQLDLEPAEAGSVRLADIDIQKTLIVPDSEDGVEVHTRMEKDKSGAWNTFTVESVAEDSGLWTVHSTGKIRWEQSKPSSITSHCPFRPIQLHQKNSTKRWYHSLERVGFRYGPEFQSMIEEVRSNGRDRWASTRIKVQTQQTELESRYMLHPSTIDGCLHAMIAAVHRGLHREMPWGVVPLKIDEMTVSFPSSALNLDHSGSCFAWVDNESESDRLFTGSLQLMSGTSESCLMEIQNLRMVAYEAAVPLMLTKKGPREPFQTVAWKQDKHARDYLREAQPTGDEESRVAVLLPHNDLERSALWSALGGTPFSIVESTVAKGRDKIDSIIIDDSDGSVLASATEDSWKSLRDILLRSAKPIVWVTRGANQGDCVDSGLPQGFLRAIRSEASDVRIVLVDADNEISNDVVAALVRYQLSTLKATDGRASDQRDSECWLDKDSRVLVPRLEPAEALNHVLYCQTNPQPTDEGSLRELKVPDNQNHTDTSSILAQQLPVRFEADGAYLLVGCLGGLGRSLTTWMLEKGCKNFIFLSRSGAGKPEATAVVDRLLESGASVEVFQVDASDEIAVSDVVQQTQRRMPIRGVVHAAMVLRDGLYEKMAFKDYQAGLLPKVQGAIALDKALANTPLDFFLMTSSISAVLGNPGQANYCTANSYLDFLALHRRRRGLAACSVALPMIEDVGVVAENAAVAESLTRKMPFGIDEKEMLTAFEAAIIHGRPSTTDAVRLGDVQLIVGLEPDAMLEAMDYGGIEPSGSFWYQDARMSTVRKALEAKLERIDTSSKGQGREGSFVSSLEGLPQEDMLAALGFHIVKQTARILGLEPETFKLQGASVASYGVDSMIGVEIQRWLFAEFAWATSVTTLSNPNTTFASLALDVAEHLGLKVKEEASVASAEISVANTRE